MRHVLTTIHITFVILVIVFLPYRSEYLLNKYSELDGEILTVEIPLSQLAVDIGHAKVPQLGLCLAGNRDLNQMSVFVCGIRPGSLVDRDGRIELGDQLLEVSPSLTEHAVLGRRPLPVSCSIVFFSHSLT